MISHFNKNTVYTPGRGRSYIIFRFRFNSGSIFLYLIYIAGSYGSKPDYRFVLHSGISSFLTLRST